MKSKLFSSVVFVFDKLRFLQFVFQWWLHLAVAEVTIKIRRLECSNLQCSFLSESVFVRIWSGHFQFLIRRLIKPCFWKDQLPGAALKINNLFLRVSGVRSRARWVKAARDIAPVVASDEDDHAQNQEPWKILFGLNSMEQQAYPIKEPRMATIVFVTVIGFFSWILM